MIWWVTCGLAVIVGVVVVLAVARGEAMQPVEPDRRDVLVPADRPLHAGDLADVRFTTALRGYRMDEVDALLARLRLQLPDPSRQAQEVPHADPRHTGPMHTDSMNIDPTHADAGNTTEPEERPHAG